MFGMLTEYNKVKGKNWQNSVGIFCIRKQPYPHTFLHVGRGCILNQGCIQKTLLGGKLRVFKMYGGPSPPPRKCSPVNCLCDRPYLIPLLFADLLSLWRDWHPLSNFLQFRMFSLPMVYEIGSVLCLSSSPSAWEFLFAFIAQSILRVFIQRKKGPNTLLSSSTAHGYSSYLHTRLALDICWLSKMWLV